MSLSLAKLQNLFQAYLMEGYRDIEMHIVNQDTDKITVEQRLGIYRHAYSARLVETLGLDYPVLKKILGERRFDRLGFAYLDAHPSHDFSICLFGRYFSEFLARQKVAVAAHAELATLEWALSQAVEAPDAPHLTFADLAKIPAESWVEMCMTLHPSVTALSFFYNVTDVWRAVNQEQPKPRWLRQKQPQHCLVWRHELRPYFMELAPAEYTLYQAMCRDENFMALCEALTAHFSEEAIPAFAGATLQKWVNQGLLSEVNFAVVATEAAVS